MNIIESNKISANILKDGIERRKKLRNCPKFGDQIHGKKIVFGVPSSLKPLHGGTLGPGERLKIRLRPNAPAKAIFRYKQDAADCYTLVAFLIIDFGDYWQVDWDAPVGGNVSVKGPGRFAA